MEPYIRLKNITKVFGGTTALNDVSFDIQKGEIHCLCGENGAGKSTLINLLAGVIQPTSGEIWLEGRKEKITSVQKSEGLGFSVVHQEVPLCLNMSIAHNVFLGHNEAVRGLFLNENYMRGETRKLLDRFELAVDPTCAVGALSIAEQSIIQIAKAVYYSPKILILDEPTAALTNDQRDIMFRIIRELVKEKQITVLYVSHRLEEVMELGDRATILRDGHFISTRRISDITMDDIVTSMVGRQIDRSTMGESHATHETLLTVKGLGKARQFRDINLELHRGEILGLAGFVGAGRTEVLSAIFGINKPDGGRIYIKGKETTIGNPRQAIRHGIGMIPENRRDDAMIAEMSVRQNAELVIRNRLARHGVIRGRTALKTMEDMKKEFSIKVGNAENSVMTLSGGNQQKVVIARWIANDPEILLCDEPTRGIDVGAKSEVYDIIRSIAARGIGILLVSSELPELLTLCDRIIVMHEGRMTGELTREEATEEKIMRLAATVPEDGAEPLASCG